MIRWYASFALMMLALFHFAFTPNLRISATIISFLHDYLPPSYFSASSFWCHLLILHISPSIFHHFFAIFDISPLAAPLHAIVLYFFASIDIISTWCCWFQFPLILPSEYHCLHILRRLNIRHDTALLLLYMRFRQFWCYLIERRRLIIIYVMPIYISFYFFAIISSFYYAVAISLIISLLPFSHFAYIYCHALIIFISEMLWAHFHIALPLILLHWYHCFIASPFYFHCWYYSPLLIYVTRSYHFSRHSIYARLSFVGFGHYCFIATMPFFFYLPFAFRYFSLDATFFIADADYVEPFMRWSEAMPVPAAAFYIGLLPGYFSSSRLQSDRPAFILVSAYINYIVCHWLPSRFWLPLSLARHFHDTDAYWFILPRPYLCRHWCLMAFCV